MAFQCYRTPPKTPWPESASELYRPNDLRLSTKLVSTFADRGCHMDSVTDPYGRILEILGRSHCYPSKRSDLAVAGNVRFL
jgi:hypothetical protein